MPHITVDYSAPLAATFDRREFGPELHAVIEKTIDTTVAGCTTRFRRVEESVIADGAGSAAHTDMVHIEVAILSGRTPEAKAELTEMVMELAKARIPALTGRRLHISVHVTDLDRDAYLAHKGGETACGSH